MPKNTHRLSKAEIAVSPGSIKGPWSALAVGDVGPLFLVKDAGPHTDLWRSAGALGAVNRGCSRLLASPSPSNGSRRRRGEQRAWGAGVQKKRLGEKGAVQMTEQRRRPPSACLEGL